MKASDMLRAFKECKINDFFGVPDSVLKEFLTELDSSKDCNYRVVANEGVAIAEAIGFHLATNKIPCVYMQNSGLGNALNPITSLAHPAIYGVPILMLIGWRGDPNVDLGDEPQHNIQGSITLQQLELLGISAIVISEETSFENFTKAMRHLIEDSALLKAVVVKQNTLEKSSSPNIILNRNYVLNYRDAIQSILNSFGSNPIVASTGYISRELLALRLERNESTSKDFLVVGGMGHAASIARSIASYKKHKNERVVCLDGDGSLLMHLGGIMAHSHPDSLIHVVLNNLAHESVGGFNTPLRPGALSEIAHTANYSLVFTCEDSQVLKESMAMAMRHDGSVFIEVLISNSQAKRTLPRPSNDLLTRKNVFMNAIANKASNEIEK